MRDFLNDSETIALLALAVHIFLVAVAAVLVSMNRRPSSAIAWVLAIIFIPLLGAVAYLFVGYSKLPKARRDKQREVNNLVLARTEGSSLVSRGADWPGWLHSLVMLNSNLGALP
ncbi:PLDc N-terminal domain-containing protein, partial [Arthrobacter sp.]|uniref:PLDc N-terminal domain-containing protein n=1 Tax=Arthrobacter sp. TaxID=1667 RepID=UPI00339B34EE